MELVATHRFVVMLTTIQRQFAGSWRNRSEYRKVGYYPHGHLRVGLLFFFPLGAYYISRARAEPASAALRSRTLPFFFFFPAWFS
jgi:hypothetical protein